MRKCLTEEELKRNDVRECLREFAVNCAIVNNRRRLIVERFNRLGVENIDGHRGFHCARRNDSSPLCDCGYDSYVCECCGGVVDLVCDGRSGYIKNVEFRNPSEEDSSNAYKEMMKMFRRFPLLEKYADPCVSLIAREVLEPMTKALGMSERRGFTTQSKMDFINQQRCFIVGWENWCSMAISERLYGLERDYEERKRTVSSCGDNAVDGNFHEITVKAVEADDSNVAVEHDTPSSHVNEQKDISVNLKDLHFAPDGSIIENFDTDIRLAK